MDRKSFSSGGGKQCVPGTVEEQGRAGPVGEREG